MNIKYTKAAERIINNQCSEDVQFTHEDLQNKLDETGISIRDVELKKTPDGAVTFIHFEGEGYGQQGPVVDISSPVIVTYYPIFKHPNFNLDFMWRGDLDTTYEHLREQLETGNTYKFKEMIYDADVDWFRGLNYWGPTYYVTRKNQISINVLKALEIPKRIIVELEEPLILLKDLNDKFIFATKIEVAQLLRTVA